MKAITSLKSGLYKKIDSVQLTVTEVKKKKQVQECSHMAHAEWFQMLNINKLKLLNSQQRKPLKNLTDKVECRTIVPGPTHFDPGL